MASDLVFLKPSLMECLKPVLFIFIRSFLNKKKIQNAQMQLKPSFDRIKDQTKQNADYVILKTGLLKYPNES